jgi:hypothetical protein
MMRTFRGGITPEQVYRSVYPATIEVLEWMNHTLVPLEQPVFEHYRGIQRLVRLVDRAAAGRIPTYAAHDAINDWNEQHGTMLDYEGILTRSSTYIFHDFGQWVAYMEGVEAQDRILSGEHDDPENAFTFAPADINWIVLLLPQDEVVVVYRSPHLGYRAIHDEDTRIVEGLSTGNLLSYTLHPQIEASLGWSNPDEITHQYTSRSSYA